VLAGLGVFGGSIYSIGRFLGAVLLAVNIFLVGWTVFRIIHSPIWAVAGSALVLLSREMLSAHAWILTEPLYITLTLVCLLCVLFYLEKGGLLAIVSGAGVAGLAILTRYAGVALLAVCCLSPLLFGKGSRRKRFLQALGIGLLGMLPIGIWLLRNALLGLALTGRSGIAFHLPSLETLTAFSGTVWRWVFPASTTLTKAPRLILLSLSLMLLFGVPLYFACFPSRRIERSCPPGFDRAMQMLALYGFIYFAVIFMSILFSLAALPFSTDVGSIVRYLQPVFIVFAVWVNLGLFFWAQILRARRATWLIPIFVELFLIGSSLINFNVIQNPLYMGYADVKRNQPELVAALRAVGPTRPIVTNDYERVYFLSGRPVYSIPGQLDAITGKVNSGQSQPMQKITALIDQGALVVIQRSSPDEKNFFDPIISTLRPIQTFGEITFYEK
jgi:hypothetical protein